MKNFFLIICFGFTFCSLTAQGIAFESLEWAEALSQAEKENKLIFIDAYTTWCAPCKQMDARIFPSKKLGTYFNENFINLKLDMEKGDGLVLKKEYEVGVFPTFLFIDSNGTLVHRKAGYLSVKELMAEAETANNPNLNLSAQNKRFEAGDNDPDFLKSYLFTKFNARDGSHLPVLKKYLATQKDWSKPENLDIIFSMTERVDDESFKYITKNKKLFVDKFGESKVSNQIQNLVFGKIQNDPNIKLDKVGDLFKIAYPNDYEKRFSQYKMTHHRQKGDRAAYANAAIEHYSKYKSNDPGELNEVAWTFYKVVNDKEQLKQACKYIKQSIKMEKAHYNMDTMAALTYKLGKKGKALKIAKKAIALAKASNEDYSSTEELIENINSSK